VIVLVIYTKALRSPNRPSRTRSLPSCAIRVHPHSHASLLEVGWSPKESWRAGVRHQIAEGGVLEEATEPHRAVGEDALAGYTTKRLRRRVGRWGREVEEDTSRPPGRTR
jgi:hypothetical protein